MEGSDIGNGDLVVLNVRGRSFLVDRSAVEDFPVGVLESLGVSIEDAGSSDKYYLAVRDLGCGFKKKVRRVIGIINGVERDDRLMQLEEDRRVNRVTKRRRFGSLERKVRKQLSERGLYNHGTANGLVVGVK